MFIFVILTSILINLILIIYSYKLPFFNSKGRTDNEKMLEAASKNSLCSWPSNIHDIKNARAELREVWVFFLTLLIKVFKFPKYEFTNITLSLVSNIFNSIFIYLIFQNLYNSYTAIIIFLFYALCFWSYQVGIYLGHILLSSSFALLSIYLITLISSQDYLLSLVFASLSGFFLIISFSSSSASRKYPPVIIFCFFAFNLEYFNFNNFNVYPYALLIAFSLLLIVYIFSRKLSSLILNLFKIKLKKKIIQNQNKYLISLQKQINFLFGILFLFCLFMLFFLKEQIFIYYFISFIIGILLGIILILWPNIFININRYRLYLNIGNWANHFNSINLERFEKKLDKDKRGGDYKWLILFFKDFMPIHFIFIIYLNIKIFLNSFFFDFEYFINLFLMFLPIIVMEISKAIRVAKSYFPFLISFLFFEGYLIFNCIENNFLSNYEIYIFLLILFAYNIFIFFKEVFYNRYYPVFLYKFLSKKNIKKFATYNNFLNDAILRPFLDRYHKEFKVEFVENIQDVKSSYFILPPISGKSLSLETNEYANKVGDFSEDQKLNRLFESGEIEDITLKSYPTLSSSKIFVLESEVTGFKHFFIDRINSKDRYFGKLRILKINE